MPQFLTLYKQGDRWASGPYVHARKWCHDSITDLVIEWGANKDRIDVSTMTRKHIYRGIEVYDGYGKSDSDIIRQAIELYDKMVVVYHETRQD